MIYRLLCFSVHFENYEAENRAKGYAVLFVYFLLFGAFAAIDWNEKWGKIFYLLLGCLKIYRLRQKRNVLM